MSVLIKGMEMPNNCQSCPFIVKNWYDTEFRCLARKEYVKVNLNTGFDDDCPLVSVPMHGRLIDADKLNVYDISPVYGFSVMGVTEEDVIQASTIIPAEEGEHEQV